MKSINNLSLTILMLILSIVSAMAFAQDASADDPEEVKEAVEQPYAAMVTVLEERQKSDSLALKDPYTLSQYRLNYLVPISYIKDPNPSGFAEEDPDSIDNIEAKYQISVKLPIYVNQENASGMYLGFTAVSFWQVYNSEISKPFRETNYEPEVFYSWQTNYRFFGIKFNQIHFGLNHQSNGQSGLRSRSWNRLYASALFSDEDSIYYLKTWYRLKEDDKVDPNSANGDDNPDITHYLGHFEIGYGKKVGNFNILALLRNNLKADNKGSIDLTISYPLSERYDVILQYFNGYGDSLIDYNRHQQRIGLGIQLKFL
ncbi:phospholipase A [Aliiglaciecola sp. LCG003]|uniref:phospholipase A n=1 Tax=Aliiglaciecola sp. LCG003 TaxID=3053655 RepID=UPI0025724885|nr:phospholipase A [Aliiglaciecola sp. LCG003]WJG09091.1 phospholipase A [Aliiglaciecola sp. LCG003]